MLISEKRVLFPREEAFYEALAMDRIKSVIIDDEKQSIELLKILLNDHCPQIEVIGTARNVESGIHLIKEKQPVLVFLDIAMPDGDGFHLLHEIGERDFSVIFVTAYDEYALKAFEFSALHYLLKPIDIDALKKAVARFEQSGIQSWSRKAQVLKQNLEGRPSKIVLSHRMGYEFVDLEDVIRIEGEENYSRFYFRQGEPLLVSKPLGEYERLLADQNFFRVHKKHLINLTYLKSFEKGKQGTIFLDGDHKVPLSYRRRDDFLDRLKDGMVF